MSTTERTRLSFDANIDGILQQQYVNFLNALSKEMDIAYEFEDRCEDIDYYRGMRQALSEAAELFRKHYEDVSSKKPRQ